MGKKREDGFERRARAGGAAGKIDDERTAEASTDRAAEGSIGRVLYALGAHALGEALDDAIADEAGGLGGDIARGQSSASGGDDEVGFTRVMAESLGDLVDFVGEDASRDRGAKGFKDGGDGGSGEVFALAVETTVADGEGDCAGVALKSHSLIDHRWGFQRSDF